MPERNDFVNPELWKQACKDAIDPAQEASYNLMMTAEGSIVAWLETGNQLPMDPCPAMKEAGRMMKPAWESWGKLQEENVQLIAKRAQLAMRLDAEGDKIRQIEAELIEARKKAIPDHDRFGNRILVNPEEILAHHAQQHLSLYRVTCVCGRKIETRNRNLNCPGCDRMLEL